MDALDDLLRKWDSEDRAKRMEPAPSNNFKERLTELAAVAAMVVQYLICLAILWLIAYAICAAIDGSLGRPKASWLDEGSPPHVPGSPPFVSYRD